MRRSLTVVLVGIAGCAASARPSSAAEHREAVAGEEHLWAELPDVSPPLEARAPRRPTLDSEHAATIIDDLAAHADPRRGVYVQLAANWAEEMTCGSTYVRRRACSRENADRIANALRVAVGTGAPWDCEDGVCRTPGGDCGLAYCALTPSACEAPSVHVSGHGTVTVLFEGTDDAPTITGVGFECLDHLGDLGAAEATARSCDASW